MYATLFTWGVTALGASLVFFFKKINKTILDGMLGFAAGVMIAASIWSLIIPGIEMSNDLGLNIPLTISCGFLSGCLIIFLVENIMNCLIKKNQNGFSFKRCILLIISITLHNIPEGLAVGVAFGAVLYNIEGASLIAAISLAIAIGIQNFPEGAAVSIPLRREGFSRLKAFFYGQLSGVVEPIAGVLGVILVLKMRHLLPFLLSFAGGAMMFVVVLELIPESQKNKSRGIIALFTMIGFVVMMILDISLG